MVGGPRRHVRKPAAVGLVRPGLGEVLGEGGPGAQGGALPVDDVDGDDEDKGNAEEDRVAVLEVSRGFVEGSDVFRRGCLCQQPRLSDFTVRGRVELW